jgi:hypothetical protein
MVKAPADRLMDMCKLHADELAELWYNAFSTNPKTPSYKSISKDGAKRHAATFYKHLGEMYFSEDCYKAVEHILDVDGFVEDFFLRGIPIEEMLYTIVLLRRHIWTFADAQALYNTVILDMYCALESVNRVTLIFDYATYIVAKKYNNFTGKNQPVHQHIKTIFPNMP